MECEFFHYSSIVFGAKLVFGDGDRGFLLSFTVASRRRKRPFPGGFVTSDPDGHRSLTRETLGGVRWTYTALVTSTVVQLVFTAVLGRLLAPRDFGLIAAGMIVINLARHFGQLGLGPAIVQKPELTDDDVKCAFGVNVAASTGLTLLIVVLAAPLAGVVGAVGAEHVVRLLSLNVFFFGLAITPKHLLQRELKFRQLAAVEMSSSVIAFLLVGIPLAVTGLGIWSLAWAFTAHSAIEAAASHWVRRHPYGLNFRRETLVPLISYGSRATVAGLLEQAGTIVETVGIARIAGPSSLGHYNRAMFIAYDPLKKTATGVSRVLFSAYSLISKQAHRLSRSVLSTLTVVAAIAFPVAGGAAAASEPLVAVLIGPQWAVAAQILPILFGAAAFRVTAQFLSVLADATAQLNARMSIEVGSVVLLLSSFATLYAAGRGSVVWMSLAVALVALLRVVALAAVVSRIASIRLTEIGGIYLRSIVAATLVFLGVRVGLLLTPVADLGAPLALIAAVGVALGVTYCCWIIGPLRRARRHVLERASALAGSRAERAVRSLLLQRTS
jgi:lipopolysaccharide exporter